MTVEKIGMEQYYVM